VISRSRFVCTERHHTEQKAERRINRRTYSLAGKGTREAMRARAEELRREWKRVAVRPFGWSHYGVATDDWSVWVNERRETPN
jgi:hypothetical protein